MIYIIKSNNHCSSILSLKSSEGINLHVLNKAVELLLGIFVLILLSANSDTNHIWDVSNAVRPQEPVQAGVNTHILY